MCMDIARLHDVGVTVVGHVYGLSRVLMKYEKIIRVVKVAKIMKTLSWT